MVIGSALGLAGCGYPSVSPDTYELAKALHSVFNQKDESDLVRARELIEQRETEGAILPKERDWLLAMIDTAEAGDWAAAETQARRLIADQVE
jgi:hypothetical protein